MIELVQTPVKMTQKEILVSSVMTLCLQQLERANTPEFFVKELCSTPQYGLTASASKMPSGQRFVRITDIQQGVVDWESVPYCECEDPNKYKLTNGDILVARTGSIGKSFLVTDVPETAVFASYLMRLRVTSRILPRYLYWCFQSQQFWGQIMKTRRGSAIKNINAKMLQALRFPQPAMSMQELIVQFVEALQKRLEGSNIDLPELPPPLDEQRRIVARIEELAAKIEEAQKLRRQAVVEAEAILSSAKNALFSSEHTKQWKSITVGEIADIRSGVTLGRKFRGPTIKLPYLRVANVQDGYLDLKTIKKVEILEDERDKWQLQSGDILLTEGGDWDKLGRGTVWHGEIEDCIHQNHIFRVRVNLDEFDPDYLCALIGSPYGKAYFQSASKQTTNLATINQRQLKAFEIFYPAIDEQRRIVANLDELQAKIDALKKYQARTADEMDALLPSVLDRAFKGEL